MLQATSGPVATDCRSLQARGGFSRSVFALFGRPPVWVALGIASYCVWHLGCKAMGFPLVALALRLNAALVGEWVFARRPKVLRSTCMRSARAVGCIRMQLCYAVCTPLYAMQPFECSDDCIVARSHVHEVCPFNYVAAALQRDRHSGTFKRSRTTNFRYHRFRVQVS
jgi:hypothetical protein